MSKILKVISFITTIMCILCYVGVNVNAITINNTDTQIVANSKLEERYCKKGNLVEYVEPDDYTAGVMYSTTKLGKFYITAYCNCSKCCGKWANGKTASGTTCHTGTITTCAVDPKVIPMGTIIEVDGKLYRAEDTGSAVKGNHIDIYLTDHKQVQKFNSHYSVIYKASFPFGKPGDQ